ncbi:MAG: hypothetical protein N2316_11075, partial [Spirochaetes bacterium]|nr:hypothetical protein [Spirochaetota bacterium]
MRIGAFAVFAWVFVICIACGGKFDNTVWECKYDYKEYQDRMTGVNVLEFLPGRKLKGPFSNPAPLPQSAFLYDDRIEDNKIICP